jgi:uncharacterized repeat protein (TIGR01451 family)
MNKSSVLWTFFVLLGLKAFAQCNLTPFVNQMPVNCADQQLTFMGYATSDCPFGYTYQYTWMAYIQDANGSQTAIPELTISGDAISGTSFEQYSIPLGAYPYVQVCLQVNVVDDLGVVQGQSMGCQSAINFPQPIALTASLGNNSCGQPTCLAQFAAIGGTAPYTYLLSNGQVITPAVWTCFDIAGNYVLTAIDANGCEASTSFTITGGFAENSSCEFARELENGVVLQDTICSINQEQPACSNGMNYFQYGWYSFNSENFAHANIAFYSGYNSTPSGGTTGYSYPSAIEIYQEVSGGGCSGSELVFCQSFAGTNSASGSGVPPCFDLADSLAIQPNTTYFIKYMTQWTSPVPVQALVMLTNEPIAPLCGCTDNTSCNYDPDALISDGSCGWSGCMDIGACNYQQWVTCDNGSCVYGSDINGFIFHDLNGDGIQQTWQPAEPVLSNIGVITIEELGVLIYPDANGQFVLPNIPQATYTISFEDANGYWMLNVDSTLQVTLPTCNGLKLPLIPASEAMAQVSGISTSENTTIHCAGGFTPGIYLYNNGNLPLSGTFTITFNPSLSYVDAPWAGTGVTVEAPTETAPGTLTWTIDSQPAGSLHYYQVHIVGPGAATTGQSFPFAFTLTLNDANGGVFYTNEWNINPTVTCSYDPNDKQATPAGWTEQHFITAGEEIEYRIRFQNTGNAPAFNVRIEDQLDITRLNLNSFSPIAASHSYSTIVTPDGMVQFVFDNIMLPDSVHDEPNSHGWVVYRIRAFDSLQPWDVINNSAAIYFDDNEPVITNTYAHTIFSCDLIPDPNGVNGTCEGQSVLLNIFPELDYTESYAWSVDSVQVGNEVMYEFPADASGNYSIVLNRTNPFCNVYDTLHVEVWPNPSTLLENINGVLIAPDGVSWDWHLDNVSMDYNFQEIVPMISGNYLVVTTNEYGCSSISNELSVVIENVEETAANSLRVYPNPTDGLVNFTIPIGYHGFYVYNATGQLMYTNTNAAGVQQLDLCGWSAGMYRLEVPGLNGVSLIVK